MRHNLLAGVTLLAVGFASEGCGTECTTEGRPGVVVRVLGRAAVNESGECAVEVLASGNEGYEEVFQNCRANVDTTGGCSCGGLVERSGIFRLEVLNDGASVFTTYVIVRVDECHVKTQDVVIDLDEA